MKDLIAQYAPKFPKYPIISKIIKYPIMRQFPNPKSKGLTI